MKRTADFWLLAAILTMVQVLASCSEKDDPVDSSVENLKDVTIIWYGTGGTNVDCIILDNFRQFYRAQPTSFDRVNIVAQYKTSFTPDVYGGKTDEEIALEGEELAAGLTDEEIEQMWSMDYFKICHPSREPPTASPLTPRKPCGSS